MYIQDWFPLGLTGLISMQPKGLSRVFSNTRVQRAYMCVICQMTSYSPCGDLITKTEFKQCAKMRVETHCPIYTHLVTRRGSFFTHGTVLDRYHARIGPGSPGRSHKTWSSLPGLQQFCLLWLVRHFKIFFCMFVLADKIFHCIDPTGKFYQKYIYLSSAVTFISLYVPNDLSL